MQNIESKGDMEDMKKASIQQELNSQLPHSWKQVADTLIKNRRKTVEKQRQGKMRQFYRLKIMNLIDQLKIKRIVMKDIDILNIDQIYNLIQQKQTLIENLIAKNQKLKKNIITAVQTIAENKEQILIKRKDLKQILKSNSRNRILNDYIRFSLEQVRQIGQSINKMNEKLILKIDDLKMIEAQIETSKQIYQRIDNEINKSQQISRLLAIQLTQSRQRYLSSTRQQLPDSKQMIECLFHIGILIQQNYIFEKLQKCLLLQQKAKLVKINKKITDRRITINSSKDILGFMVITTIYMHCKSLLMSNIVNTMQRLSYYQAEFKSIYDFQLFQRYCKIFIEKEKFNDSWKLMKSQLYSNSLANEFIRILYVTLDEKIKTQVFQYMQIYQNNNQNFYLKISNNYTMMMKIVSLDQFLSQKNGNDEKNVLHIKFKEKFVSEEAQELNDIYQV